MYSLELSNSKARARHCSTNGPMPSQFFFFLRNFSRDGSKDEDFKSWHLDAWMILRNKCHLPCWCSINSNGDSYVTKGSKFFTLTKGSGLMIITYEILTHEKCCCTFYILYMSCFKLACRSQFSSVTQSCPTLCHPMNCNTPDFPVHHQLLKLAQTHVHRVGVLFTQTLKDKRISCGFCCQTGVQVILWPCPACVIFASLFRSLRPNLFLYRGD